MSILRPPGMLIAWPGHDEILCELWSRQWRRQSILNTQGGALREMQEIPKVDAGFKVEQSTYQETGATSVKLPMIGHANIVWWHVAG